MSTAHAPLPPEDLRGPRDRRAQAEVRDGHECFNHVGCVAQVRDVARLGCNARVVSFAIVGLLLVLAGGCGPRASRSRRDEVPWASSGVDWSKPPAITPDATVDAPRVTTGALLNGVRIVVVENHRLPIIAITAVHHRAGGREDGTTHGLAALTADVIVRGTEIEASVATDHASHHIVTTTSQLAANMLALSHAFRQWSFSDEEVERVRDRRVRELEDRRTRPRTIAAQVFDHMIFGTHPYAWPAEGVADDVAKMTAADVRTFWQRAYAPDTLTLIFSGDISQSAAYQLTVQSFATRVGAIPRTAAVTPPALPSYTSQLAIVDRPGATDAVVIVGRLLPGLPDETERSVREVSNAILGGGVTGRLEHRLHDELGITFGASSSFWRGTWASTWTAAATFRTEAAVTGMRELLALIEAARSEPPTAREVEQARAAILRGNAQRFDTATSSARAFERLVVRGDSLDTYVALPARLGAVEPSHASAVVRDAWRELSVVVVGDRARLTDALAATGLPIVAFGPDGRRLP